MKPATSTKATAGIEVYVCDGQVCARTTGRPAATPTHFGPSVRSPNGVDRDTRAADLLGEGWQLVGYTDGATQDLCPRCRKATRSTR